MSINVGTQAPEFELLNTAKEPVKLSDFSGKNLLVLFFPFAFTGVCTTELCTIRDDISRYKNMEVDVVAISVDSPFTLEKFKEEQNLNFDLLSDFNKTVTKSYDVLYHEFPAFGLIGVSKRAAFVVNKAGEIVYKEVCDSPGDLPDFNAINTAIEGLS